MSDQTRKPSSPKPAQPQENGQKPVLGRPWTGLAGDGRAALEGARRILRAESRAKGGGGAGTKIPEGGGQKLPGTVRSSMERKLGANLGNVKIHTGGESAKAAGGLSARDVEALRPLRPDWFAVRGAACGGRDRAAAVEEGRVRRLAELLRAATGGS